MFQKSLPHYPDELSHEIRVDAFRKLRNILNILEQEQQARYYRNFTIFHISFRLNNSNF